MSEYKSGVTWICDVCKETRPDDKISVRSIDISVSHGLEPGILSRNVKYCNDKPECCHVALTSDYH